MCSSVLVHMKCRSTSPRYLQAQIHPDCPNSGISQRRNFLINFYILIEYLLKKINSKNSLSHQLRLFWFVFMCNYCSYNSSWTYPALDFGQDISRRYIQNFTPEKVSQSCFHKAPHGPRHLCPNEWVTTLRAPWQLSPWRCLHCSQKVWASPFGSSWAITGLE